MMRLVWVSICRKHRRQVLSRRGPYIKLAVSLPSPQLRTGYIILPPNSAPFYVNSFNRVVQGWLVVIDLCMTGAYRDSNAGNTPFGSRVIYQVNPWNSWKMNLYGTKKMGHKIFYHTSNFCRTSQRYHTKQNLSRHRWFPTMWYVRQAKPQISLCIHTVWSEPLLVAWLFYEC